MSYPIHIYKIFWSDCDDFYIGSTKEKLCKRMGNHRTYCRKGRQSKLHNVMREKGLNNFQYVLISTHNVSSKDEQRQAEQKVINELKPTLNMVKAFISKEERKQYKKEWIQEYRKKDKVKAKMREYREKDEGV